MGWFRMDSAQIRRNHETDFQENQRTCNFVTNGVYNIKVEKDAVSMGGGTQTTSYTLHKNIHKKTHSNATRLTMVSNFEAMQWKKN